jgi:hypothetical protein
MLHNLIKNAAEASKAGDAISCELRVAQDYELRVHNPARVPIAIEKSFFEKYASHGKDGGTGRAPIQQN